MDNNSIILINLSNVSEISHDYGGVVWILIPCPCFYCFLYNWGHESCFGTFFQHKCSISLGRHGNAALYIAFSIKKVKQECGLAFSTVSQCPVGCNIRTFLCQYVGVCSTLSCSAGEMKRQPGSAALCMLSSSQAEQCHRIAGLFLLSCWNVHLQCSSPALTLHLNRTQWDLTIQTSHLKTLSDAGRV